MKLIITNWIKFWMISSILTVWSFHVSSIFFIATPLSLQFQLWFILVHILLVYLAGSSSVWIIIAKTARSLVFVHNPQVLNVLNRIVILLAHLLVSAIIARLSLWWISAASKILLKHIMPLYTCKINWLLVARNVTHDHCLSLRIFIFVYGWNSRAARLDAWAFSSSIHAA